MGILGYVNKGSVQSIIAGSISGILVLIGTFISQRNPTIGYGLAAFVALAMLGRFIPAYMKDTSKVYPALVVILLSGIAFGALAWKHFSSCECKASSETKETVEN